MWVAWLGAHSGDPGSPFGLVEWSPLSIVVHQPDLLVTDLSGDLEGVLEVLTVVVTVVPPLSLVEEESDSSAVNCSPCESWFSWSWRVRNQVATPECLVVSTPFSVIVHEGDLLAVDDLGHAVVVRKPLSPVLVVSSPLAVVVEEFHSLPVDGAISHSWVLWSWCDGDHVLVPDTGVILHPFSAIEHHLHCASVDYLRQDIVVLDVLGPVVVVFPPLTVVVEVFNSLSVDGSVSDSWSSWFWLSGPHESCPDVSIVWHPSSTVVHISNSFSVDISVGNALRGQVLGVVLVVVSPLSVEEDVPDSSSINHSVGGAGALWLGWSSLSWSDSSEISVPEPWVVWLPSAAEEHVPDSSSVHYSVVHVLRGDVLRVVLVVRSPLAVEVDVSNTSAVNGTVSGSCTFWLSVSESTESEHS